MRVAANVTLTPPTHACNTSPVATDELLIERLLRVIDEGRRTATYKLALLLALIDAAATSPGQAELPTRVLAERVLELYYPQTRAYVDRTGAAHNLRQISMKQPAVLAAVTSLRLAAAAHGTHSLHHVRQRMAADYQHTLDAVEDTFVRYPIPLMQVVGGTSVPFLYSVDWAEGTAAKKLRPTGDDKVRLLDGVADRLVVIGPMLRPLIELHWARDVARWTRLPMEDDDLRSHLFGTERTSFPKRLVSELSDLQHHECFYCGDRLTGRGEVDHFLAWSRWPNDAIENLVLADRCNGHKSNHLAATEHLVRWRLRLAAAATDLRTIATATDWVTDADRTHALVHTTYTHMVAGTPLWLRGNEFELATGPTTL